MQMGLPAPPAAHRGRGDRSPGTAKVTIVGLPYDANASFLQGPQFAPNRIREALHGGSANLTSETGLDLGEEGAWHDMGDLRITELGSDAAFAAIRGMVADVLGSSSRLVSLGGDHSVSFPLIQAHAEHFPNLNVLHIDAHPDLYDVLSNNVHSHGTPFARAMETGLVKRLVQIGIRTLNHHQREQARKFNVEIVDMISWNPGIELTFNGPVYLSVDLDGLDPAFAPGVSHHEPGGLSTRDVLDLIHKFKGTLVGADIVELNPHRDVNNTSAMVAAKLLKEISSRLIGDMVTQ